MGPTFYPRLINGPFDDPGLILSLPYVNRALLFDLGDIHNLPAKDILKVSHAFISHTHMDHWIGFDRLMRLQLGREKTLHIYGPDGFLSQVEAKLAGYSWNLVQNYNNRFSIIASEIRKTHLLTQCYCCKDGFLPSAPARKKNYHSKLLEDSGFSVSAVILDHLIPSVGYCIQERFHVNIKKTALMELGLTTGPWISTFKRALLNNEPPDMPIRVQWREKIEKVKTVQLGDLAGKITVITPGQKVVYFADAGNTKINTEKMIAMAQNADHLFIEASFLDRDRDIAEKKYHLTAGQAGAIAGKARVKHFTLFHFSPRYKGQDLLFQSEAETAYRDHMSK